MLDEKNDHETEVSDWIRERLRTGIQLLATGFLYVQTSKVPTEEFSVGYRRLNEIGLYECDIRWLMLQGFVEHHIELTLQGDKIRTFRPGGAIFGENSCWSLTQAGFHFSAELADGDKSTCCAQVAITQSSDPKSRSVCETSPCQKPVWDTERQELWFQEQLVKRFRLPSPCQTAILSTFQEDDWPPRIDDPLSPHVELDAKRRLNDTIRNLNRAHQRPLLRFVGDGSGQGVLWERVG